MKVIGLTGGMGAGKSTAAAILKKLGAYIIDADEIAKRSVKKGGKTLAELTARFGTGILNTQGELDRKKLSDIVFNSPSELADLNKIVHSEVFREIRNEINRLEAKQFNGILVLDVPIPTLEFRELAHQIWVIDAEPDMRLKRVLNRGGLSEEEALNRMRAQPAREDYFRMADIIVENSSSVSELEKRLRKLIEKCLGG